MQEEIEKALSKLLSEKIRLIGAGRTDKGVSCQGNMQIFFQEKNFK